MESHATDGGGAELQQVTRVLSDALAEACGTEVRRADTGELQRVERALTVASEAAKQVVNLRRRKRASRATPAAPAASGAEAPAGTMTTGEMAALSADELANRPHRMFVDAAGVTWDAFAVYPTSRGGGRARLPASYQHGWLSFDSGNERRRLGPIPDDWVTMSDEALCRCCERAELAPRRFGA